MPTEVPTILVVDDSKVYLKMYSTALSEAGFRVLSTNDVHGAIITAETCSPDLIVMDLLMPGMDGVEALRVLKRNPATTHLPIIIISSLSEKNAQKLMDEGALAYLQKEKLTEETLKRVVNIALSKGKTTRSPA